MGHKGVSKRKPSKIKPKPLSGGGASDSVSSVVQAAKSAPVKAMDTSKAASFPKGNVKKSSDRIKNTRKG